MTPNKMNVVVEPSLPHNSMPGATSSKMRTTQVITRHIEKRLPAAFIPGPTSVIFGRSKTCYDYSGNQRLKEIVGQHAAAYSQAQNKNEKIAIVNSIIQETGAQNHRPGDTTVSGLRGQFVVKKGDGVWYDVDSTKVRDKIGGLLRERLHSQYRSSSKSKKMILQAKRILQESQQAIGTALLATWDPEPLPPDSSFCTPSSVCASAQYRQSTDGFGYASTITGHPGCSFAQELGSHSHSGNESPRIRKVFAAPASPWQRYDFLATSEVQYDAVEVSRENDFYDFPDDLSEIFD